MKFYIIPLAVCFGIALAATAQDRVTANPDSASIITADIAHFWRAFDLLTSQRSTRDSLQIIQHDYVDEASEGLRLYMRAANSTASDFLEAIRKKAPDYRRVRAQSLALKSKKPLLLKYLKRFKHLYPDLRIPTICLTIGKFQVGGSPFDSTLFVGCEVDILHHVDIVPQTIHELAHYQQKDQKPVTNLELAMIEGGAEFMCFQVTGERTIPLAWRYGIAHEKSLWNEFRPTLDSAIDMKWFLDIPDGEHHRPGSLAYFIGFRICEAYLNRRTKKKLGLQTLCAMERPKKIFEESLYMPRSDSLVY